MIQILPWYGRARLSVNWDGGPSVHLEFFCFVINLGTAFGFSWFHFQVHQADYAWRNILCWSSDG